MTRTATVIRTIFALAFLGGSVIHVYWVLTNPQVYANFDATIAFPWAEQLWTGIVMPHINVFVPLLAAIELLIGIGLVAGRHYVWWAAVVMVGFFLMLLVLGYAYPATSLLEDFAMNRAGTVVMVLMCVPLLATRTHPTLLAAWQGFFRRQPRPSHG